MQTTGYVVIDGKEILILIRQCTYSRRLKIRYSGTKNSRMTDEEKFLLSHPNHVARLMAGEVLIL